MINCEPVLTEAVYFLREDGLEVDPLFRLLERGALRLQFDVSTHWPRIRTLMARYTHMDLADASIVVMRGFQHIQTQRPADDRFRGAAQTVNVTT